MEKRRQDVQQARCPLFCARIDYNGRSYIRCGAKNWRYQSSNERESQYRSCCCERYEQCNLYKNWRGNT